MVAGAAGEEEAAVAEEAAEEVAAGEPLPPGLEQGAEPGLRP